MAYRSPELRKAAAEAKRLLKKTLGADADLDDDDAPAGAAATPAKPSLESRVAALEDQVQHLVRHTQL